jgi:uncharacterized protein YndB with AHSA1/START domain
MNKIKIKAVMKANSKKVWDYYTQPKHIVKWNFASDDWRCPSAKNDLKVGGKLKARMESKDGELGFDLEGIYTELLKGHHFTYKMDEREVSVIFVDLGDITELNLIFDPEDINPVKVQKQGWEAILDNFRMYVE